ncbi:unnamed protein product [Clonostachys byssicola]|uniref:Uncharacterized protein n=1 Tax=Clonostachys byssicola TaxID=160290 RepID=A0A9N9Y5W8_9HYPO|nr:unnamed protein product [Clonostachys byssicola]
MGGVLSCIQSIFRTIGDAIMAVISGVGRIIVAIVNAIVSFCGIIVSFLTCGYCGRRRGGAGHHRSRGVRRSHV